MAKIIIALITVILLIGVATGQSRLKDVPIVSDKAVERTDTLRIVDKDENQRIITKLVERIQKLENRVSILESDLKSEVSSLESKISKLKDEIEGG